jgi:F0F1-type ATP synthase membrane subunit b/b'
MTEDKDDDYYDDKEFISEIARNVKEQVKDAKRQMKEARKEAKRAAKEKAREAKEDFTRINFTLPTRMKEDWKDMAADLSKSVSQLVRDAMGLYKSEIYNVEKIVSEKGEEIGRIGEKFGKEMGQLGDKFAKIAVRSGIKPPMAPTPPKPPRIPSPILDVDIERVKRRVEGLIKLQKSIPLKKLAQALNITQEEAENLIYELAAEGISGSLEDDVFKYTNDEDEVIDALLGLIEKM